MIRAELKGDTIFLSAERESAIYIQRIRGAFRTSKMPPLTWALKLTCDAIDDLRREKVLVSPELAQKARSMLAARKYVDEQKAADKVEPMKPIPIKADYSLFNHQVKAFNIALALFGYDTESTDSAKGGDVHVHVQ